MASTTIELATATLLEAAPYPTAQATINYGYGLCSDFWVTVGSSVVLGGMAATILSRFYARYRKSAIWAYWAGFGIAVASGCVDIVVWVIELLCTDKTSASWRSLIANIGKTVAAWCLAAGELDDLLEVRRDEAAAKRAANERAAAVAGESESVPLEPLAPQAESVDASGLSHRASGGSHD